MRRTPLFALVAPLLLASACGTATGRGYRGLSLLSLHGELLLAPGTDIQAPVRLALIWTPFPNLTGGANEGAKAVVAQDVPYTGTFPVSYRFDLTAPPPPEVLGDLGLLGGSGRAARGYLVAYEDLNGNGKLDLIAPGGSAADRVLGASFNPAHAGDRSFVLQYTDGIAPPYQRSIPEGFALLSPGLVDPATSIPIYLTDAVPLNWLVCTQVLVSASPSTDATCSRTPALRVRGEIGARDGVPMAQLTVTDANFPIDDKFITSAQVVVNGVQIAYRDDPYSFAYAASGASLAPLNGVNTLHVHQDGYPDLDLTLPTVGDFQLLGPDVAHAALTDSTLSASWSGAAGAASYRVSLTDGPAFGIATDPTVTTATSAEVPTPHLPGPLELEVRASAPPVQTPDGTEVESVNVHTERISVSQPLAVRWSVLGNHPAVYAVSGTPTGTDVTSSAISSSTAASGDFGAIGASVDARPYAGARVRLQGIASTENVTGWAGLWMRVDDDSGNTVAFDNMQARGISGTTPARVYDVILDVPPNAATIHFGALLDGNGTANFGGFGLEPAPAGELTTESRGDGIWFLAGSMPAAYASDGDPTAPTPGGLTLTSQSAPASAFGTLMMERAPNELLGKRVRLSATVSTTQVAAWAGLWMRVDGQGTVPLAFDNMQDRPLTGTTGPQRVSVVLDVSPDAVGLALGVLLDGSGTVQVNDLTVEVVDGSVPTTG